MREQIAQHRLPRRASATPEELAARRTNAYTVANNHRAGYRAGLHPEDAPYLSEEIYQSYEEDDDRLYDTRLPSSARRYQTDADGRTIQQGNRRIVIHQRQHPTGQPPPARQQVQKEPPQKNRRVHWLVFVGLAMFVMLAGWIAVSFLMNWWQVSQDDLHYGRPRTFQIDMKVGHGDDQTPSHFLAMNLNRHIQIIECPAGDCTKAVIYTGPQLYGDGQDITPVTLSFKDVNGDGKPDMLVHIANQTYVFINENGKFRPLRPDDHLSL